MKEKINNQDPLLLWAQENEKDWYTICGMGEEDISAEEFLRIWEALEENGFYNVTMILLFNHYGAIQKRISENIKAVLSFMEDNPRKREIERILSMEQDDMPLQ